MDALRALLLVALLTHGTVLSAAAPGAGDAHDVDADAARLAAVVDPATRLRVVHPPRAEAALDSSRVVTRIAFGSCNKHDRDQSYWRRIRDRKPDLWVWLGDIVYADTPVFLKWRIPATAAALQAYYTAQLASPEYGALLEEVPVVGVYDDHDAGTNDADKHAYADDPVARALSPQLFLDFIGEADASPRRRQPGVYAHYVLGAAPRRVHLILLDVRTQRDPYFGGDAQDFLGEAQWAWLGRVLADTRAEVTLIGSGVQVLPRGDPWIAEMWYKLPQSRARLLAMLAAARVHGALFLSGDVHFGELSEVTCPAVGYPLLDVTSSGLTHAWRGFIKRTTVHTCLMGAERAPGTSLYADTNWGEVEIEWAAADGGDTVDAARTNVTVRVWGITDGVAHIARTVALEALAPARGAADGDGGPARAAALACARAPLSRGLTPECAAFIGSCTPHLRPWHHVKYWVGHAAVIGGLAAVGVGVLAGPAVAWFVGPALPGGRVAAIAVLVAGYAALAAFIDSIH